MGRSQRVDTVILQEDLAFGERVRGFVLEGRTGGVWSALGRGTAIGHKRILPVEAREVNAVRLRVTEAAAPPRIRRVAVFNTGRQPPPDWNEASELWAPNLVGRWKNGSFSLDLGHSITAAAQYALRFVSTAGTVRGFAHISLTIGGIPSPGFVRISSAKKDELLLNITALNASIEIAGEVIGAERGQITLDRI